MWAPLYLHRWTINAAKQQNVFSSRLLCSTREHTPLQTAEVCEQRPGRQLLLVYMTAPGWQEEDFCLAAGVNKPPYAPVGDRALTTHRFCRSVVVQAALEDFCYKRLKPPLYSMRDPRTEPHSGLHLRATEDE